MGLVLRTHMVERTGYHILSSYFWTVLCKCRHKDKNNKLNLKRNERGWEVVQYFSTFGRKHRSVSSIHVMAHICNSKVPAYQVHSICLGSPQHLQLVPISFSCPASALSTGLSFMWPCPTYLPSTGSTYNECSCPNPLPLSSPNFKPHPSLQPSPSLTPHPISLCTQQHLNTLDPLSVPNPPGLHTPSSVCMCWDYKIIALHPGEMFFKWSLNLAMQV